ncbi:hypothetical protein GCM10020219_090130 [Nonomuraea dietziae]
MLDLTQDVGALTAAIVDIESVSGDEKFLADTVEQALRALPHLTVDRSGETVVARTFLGRPERVVIAGHLDTVPVAGNLPSRIEGDLLYGCGTSDMKGRRRRRAQAGGARPRTQPRRHLRLLRLRGDRGRAQRPDQGEP